MQKYLEYILIRLPEIVASAIVFVILYYALDLSAKLYFSIIAAFLTFSILTFLREPVRFNISPRSKEKSPYLLYFSVYVLCAIAIITMPSINGLELINWLNVPIINLVRLAASIVLTTFFPGFMILKIIRHNGGKLEKFVFSIIISLFLTSIIQFFIVLSGAEQFTILVLVITNFLLLILCFASSFRKQELKESTLKTIHMENSEVFVIIMLVVLQLAFTYCMLSSDFPLPMNDETSLYGFAVYVSKGAIPTSVSNPFLLMTYLSANFILSGLPSINTFQVLHFLNILPILAFYLCLKALLGRRFPKVPILGTLIGFFSGYTWIYAISLRYSGSGSGLYNLLSGAYSKVPGFPLAFYLAPYLTAAQMVGVASVLLLIYLVCSKEELNTKRLFLISIVTAYGYLGHIFDICVFLVFFLFMVLVFDLKKMSIYRRMGASIFIGLVIVVIMNLFDPAHRYSGFLLIFSLSLTVLAMFVSFLREKIRFEDVTIAIGKLNKLAKSRCAKIVACFSLVYLFGLGILTYLYVFPNFNIGATFFDTKYGNGGQIVPWYSYPIIMGTAGFLSIAGVLYFLTRESEKKEEFYPYLMLAISTLLIALGLRLFPITEESRLLTYLWVPICVFAGYSVSKLSGRFYRIRPTLKKKTIFSAIFVIILITGLLSTLEYVEVLSTMNAASFPISSQEFEALNYIRFNIPLNDTVLTLSSESSDAITGFGGTLNVISGDYAETFFQLIEPQNVLNQLLNMRVKYIYIGPEDLELINSTPSIKDGYICSQLFQSLPIAYRNSKVTVYLVTATVKASSATAVPTSQSVFGIGNGRIFVNDTKGNKPLYCLPITITNSQSSATGFNFQCLITVDSNTYSAYEASNLSNVCFQDGASNLLKSWLESGENSSCTSTNYWVLLPNGIAANSSLTIYMTFQSTSVNSMDGSTTGAEPNYTGTYGQYDNGANIFSNYWNFAGTSLPSEWTSGYGTITVNNGLTLSWSGTTSAPAGIYRSITVSYPYVFDVYSSQQAANDWCGAGMSQNLNGITNNAIVAQYTSGGSYQVLTAASGVYNIGTSTSQSYNTNTLFSTLMAGTSNVTLYANYVSKSTSTTDIPSASSLAYLFIGKSDGDYSGYHAGEAVYWLRTRAYPPNGVMPSVSYGAVQPIVIVTGQGSANIALESAPPQITLSNIAYGQANMSGTMTVRTDSVFALAGVSEMTLTSGSSGNFSDEHVDELQSIGSTELVFNANECLIKPFSGEYVWLEPKGYVNMLIYTTNFSMSSTSFGTRNFTGNQSIEVNGSDVTILVRDPVINVQGSIYLNESIIISQVRTVLIDQWPCTVKGNISFNINSSEGQIIFFNNLKYEGVLESNQPYSNGPPLSEWQIPLVEILVSPINVLIIAIAILISLELNHVKIRLRVERS